MDRCGPAVERVRIDAEHIAISLIDIYRVDASLFELLRLSWNSSLNPPSLGTMWASFCRFNPRWAGFLTAVILSRRTSGDHGRPSFLLHSLNYTVRVIAVKKKNTVFNKSGGTSEPCCPSVPGFPWLVEPGGLPGEPHFPSFAFTVVVFFFLFSVLLPSHRRPR